MSSNHLFPTLTVPPKQTNLHSMFATILTELLVTDEILNHNVYLWSFSTLW